MPAEAHCFFALLGCTLSENLAPSCPPGCCLLLSSILTDPDVWVSSASAIELSEIQNTAGGRDARVRLSDLHMNTTPFTLLSFLIPLIPVPSCIGAILCLPTSFLNAYNCNSWHLQLCPLNPINNLLLTSRPGTTVHT